MTENGFVLVCLVFCFMRRVLFFNPGSYQTLHTLILISSVLGLYNEEHEWNQHPGVMSREKEREKVGRQASFMVPKDMPNPWVKEVPHNLSLLSK